MMALHSAPRTRLKPNDIFDRARSVPMADVASRLPGLRFKGCEFVGPCPIPAVRGWTGSRSTHASRCSTAAAVVPGAVVSSIW